MNNTCFISYHKPNRKSAVDLKRRLEVRGVEVFLYDPESLWSDPITILVEALMEVDTVVNLNPKAPSPWKKAELLWANYNDRPVIDCDLAEISDTVESVASCPERPFSNILRGTRFVWIHDIMQRYVSTENIINSDFFNLEDWYLLVKVEPMIPDLNQLFYLMRDDDDSAEELAVKIGGELGYLFNEFEDLARYLQIASAVHPMVFSGEGIALSGNRELVKLSLYSSHELEKLFPMGLERLRGLRDGILKELPRF